MRQVPKNKYCMVGSGNLYRHLSQYFSLKNIPYSHYSRSSTKTLKECANDASVVLLLISDDALEDFVNKAPFLSEKTLVHFSGSMTLDKVFSAHPLMTFSNPLYDLNTYEKIPFVTDNELNFRDVFSELSNPFFSIDESQKPYYHALCVLSGNLPQILWSEVSRKLKKNLNLPPEIINLFITKSLDNWLQNKNKCLSGPFARKDLSTIRKNLDSLKGDSLEPFYQSIMQLIFENQIEVKNNFQTQEQTQEQTQ